MANIFTHDNLVSFRYLMPGAARKANDLPTAAPVHGAEDMNRLRLHCTNP